MSRKARPRVPLKTQLTVALRQLFKGASCHLDHEPALMLRERRSDGGYIPDACDPEYLIWRTVEDHRIKTYVRGDGAQLPDAGKRRKEIRRQQKANPKRWKRQWPKRKF